MRSRVIHLISPKTDSLTTRPLYFNRALYSPLAGLLAVAAAIPRDRYEVVLTDENIESIDFDLKADLVKREWRAAVLEAANVMNSARTAGSENPARASGPSREQPAAHDV